MDSRKYITTMNHLLAAAAASCRQMLYSTCIAVAIVSTCQQLPAQKITGRAFYLNNSGNDASDGSRERPWKSIAKLNSIRFLPGDRVYFSGGQIFQGTLLLDAGDAGSNAHAVSITSYGNGKAIINGADSTALKAIHTGFITISRLAFTGAGRKTGNTTDGVIISQCSQVVIDSIDIKGFQKSGLLIHSSSSIEVTNVYATENGFAGIYAVGEWDNKNCSNIHISHCTAENNPGDPSNLTNHSGNGILAGYCKNILIDYCSAGNNGWDMPRKGNGPVGIWCFEADSVIIQHCISYKNKTAPGAADGGGFDLDGGVTNSIIQYCLSYENEGSGFGIFQYAGAGNWNNNTIRYCISENDGSVSPAHAGVFVWNSSGDSSQLRNCFFYNNTVYNAKGAAISYEALSAHTSFYFYNNIFVARDSLVIGKHINSIYLGNNWYSLQGAFNMDGFRNFKAWTNSSGKEKYRNWLMGSNTDPRFARPGNAAITNPALLTNFNNYRLPAESVLRQAGIHLQQSFQINNGGRTFNGTKSNGKGMGACL